LYPVPWLYRYGMVLLLLGALGLVVALAVVLRTVGVQ
jgi:hypothetical protein